MSREKGKKKCLPGKCWRVLSAVTAILLIASIVGTFAAVQYGSAAINMLFGTENFRRIYDTSISPVDVYTSDYGPDRNGETLLAADMAIIEETEGEGAVLLWNRDGTLPLVGNERVSLFNRSSTELVETGSGSGWIPSVSQEAPNVSHAATLLSAFESRGLTVNRTLWDFYATGDGSGYQRTNPKSACTEGRRWSVNEVPWSVYTDAVKASFPAYGDVAFLVLSRTGGEYSDLHFNGTENDGGNYLELTAEEKELLSRVKAYREDGTFRKVVLLLNCANPISFKDILPYGDAIDACMWIGQVGTSGANAAADLLVGNLNPSGRLTDTWLYDNEAAPATENDGDYTYAGNIDGLGNNQNRYMVYQEGIYVGYRYFETRYADCVMGQGNAGSSVGAKNSAGGWDYSSEVAFPFGFGESYTSFALSDFLAVRQGGNYQVSVTVTNTGNAAGKEVVQVYLQKPYTAYDREMGIEKAAVELVGYGKTSLLEPGKSETVTVTVQEEQFKTYDANGAGTYIVEAGDYYLTAATDAHGALDNILTAQGYTPPAYEVFGGGRQEIGGGELVAVLSLQEDLVSWSVSSQTGVEIVNRFDSCDINKYANAGDNSVIWLSRSDWAGTYPAAVTLTMNTAMAADLAYDLDPVETPGAVMPAYKTVVEGKPLTVMDFVGAPLNEFSEGWSDEWDAKWERLLDQMTWEEQAFICANAFHQLNGAASIGLPYTRQENGPVGITKRSDFPLPNNDIADYHWVAYSCGPVVGATFNVELAERVGQHMSEDMLYLGYNGIYGPGVNLHRSPFGGRNFEYPSEDPYLAGTIEYAKSKGIESKGCMAYAKHYALNDTETNRVNLGVWGNEQATRELYLHAFELVFARGGASAAMNSFTRVGTKWCGASYALLTTVLRQEWGFDGIVISDWDSGGPMSKVDGILAGTDSFDGNNLASAFAPWRNSPAVARALREATKRIIYNVLQTNAMNGMNAVTRIEQVTPWWEIALVGLCVGMAALFGLCAALSVRAVKKSGETAKAAVGAIGKAILIGLLVVALLAMIELPIVGAVWHWGPFAFLGR